MRASNEITFFGVSHVDLPVRDLARAKRLYSGVLGFVVRAEGEGWADLDTGTGALRLVETRRSASRVAIRVQTPTVEAAIEYLSHHGTTIAYPAARTPDQQLVGAVQDPDGNTIYLWRPLTEDEYGFDPDLPTELTWEPDAEALLKSLLKSVPVLFRILARRRVVAVAEELAGPRKLVTREEVIRGMILASPKITRERNRRPLIEHGIDVDRYAADWEEP